MSEQSTKTTGGRKAQAARSGRDQAPAARGAQPAPTGRRLPPAERRAQLAQAALAVAAEQGYARLSLDDVAERAGVTRNLLYHYFPRGRLDVFLAALERAGDELTGGFIVDPDQPLAERLLANTLHSIEHAAEPSDAWRVMRHAHAAAEPEIDALRKRYRDVIVTGIAINQLGTDDPPPLALVALRAYLDFHQSALDEWRDSDVDRETLLRLLEDVLLASVAVARSAVAGRR
ncbi:MAG TPA: TetR/AcrR family transcriptional regulator [Solirubrobacteraceae bacterium]|jgi:AcrR family transcriptional regulator